MKPSWNQLIESGFDRSLYSDHPPGGTWSARIEQSAWAKLPGIHLFLLHLGNSERFWLFVPYSRPELYTLFRDLPDGSSVELNVRRGVGGRLSRLLSAKSVAGDSNVAPSYPVPLGLNGQRLGHDAAVCGGRAARGRALVRRRSLPRVKRPTGTTIRRRAEIHTPVQAKRRRIAPTPSLPLSAFRRVTVCRVDLEKSGVWLI
jgi:hypothetical protein